MRRIKSFLLAVLMLFFAGTANAAPAYFDGQATNFLLKGYLSGQKNATLDNLTADYWIATLPAAGVFQISVGNLKVGNGTPTVSLNGEDTYLEGTLEVDGAVRFDNATLTLRGVAYTLPAADGGASTYLQTSGAGVLSWAAGTSGTLDDAYNAGITIIADAGAVAITNNAADNNGVLTLTKNPVGAQSGDALTITIGAQATGDALQFVNTGSGNDLAGSGATWSMTKAGALTAASGTFSGAVTAGSVSVSGAWTIGNGAATISVNSSSWDISTAGAFSGVTTIGMSGDLTNSAGDFILANGKALKGSITDAQTIAIQSYDVDGAAYVNSILLTNGNTPAIAIGTGAETVAINSADWDISTTGAMTGIGAITMDGLLTGSAGATITGAAINLNASSNFAVNIGTGTTNAAVTVGGGSNTVAVNSSVWDITTAGALTGITGITFSSDANTIGLVSDGDADDLTIRVTGATNSSLVLSSTGTAADALQLTASAGGILVSPSGAMADQFKVLAAGTIAGNAINLATSDGGIVLTATGAANGDMTLTVGDDLAINATGDVAITSADWGITAAGVVTGIASVSFDSATVIYHDTVELSNADIKALRATPKQLVAAPGVNKFIELVSAVLILDYGTNVLTETADNLVIEYNTSSVDITGAIEATGFIDATADTIKIVYATITDVSAANAVNKAVQLFNTGDGEFGGNAAADTTMTVKVAYRVHADGL